MHNGGHAGEVLRAAALGCALQHLGEAADGDRRGEAVGVDLVGGRGEEDVHALGARRARRPAPRRAGSGRDPRSGRTGPDYEQGDHDDVGLLARAADQGEVAAVERAHGGDQADAAAGAPLGCERLAQLRDSPHRPHAVTSSPASARVCRTSASKRSRSSGAASSRARALGVDRAVVAARDGAGERASGSSSATLSTVRRTSGARSARASCGARPAPAAIRSAAARSVTSEVGGDGGGGVVRGPALVVDLEGRPCPAARRARAAKARRPGWSRRRRSRRRRRRRARRRPARRCSERAWSVCSGSAERRSAGGSARPGAWRRSCDPRSGAAPGHRGGRRGLSRRPARTGRSPRSRAGTSPRPAGPSTSSARLAQRRGQRRAEPPAPTTPTRSAKLAGGASGEAVGGRVHALPVHSVRPVAAGSPRIPGRVAVVARSLGWAMQARSAAERRAELVELYQEARAATRVRFTGPDDGGVRRRQRRRRPDVRGRGARASRGPPGPALRRAGRASCSTSCSRRSGSSASEVFITNVLQVPAAREPRPAARGDRRPASPTCTGRSS